MGAKKVLLLGLDANNGPHFFDDELPGDRGWRVSISKIPNLFRSALDQINARGIQVFNGSKDSLIDAFPRGTIEQGLEWIQADEQ